MAITPQKIEAASPKQVSLTYVMNRNVLLITYRFEYDIIDHHVAIPVEVFRGAACELTAAQSRKALGLPQPTPLILFDTCE